MPLLFTIFIAKIILLASRILGRGGGSALPGLVAEKLDPSIGHRLAARIPHGSIIITGTNGKTTTSKMVAKVLGDRGEKLVRNRAGSNLSRGVVSALVEHASFGGRFKENMGLFEVDEAAMPAVCRMLQPRAIVVLNLFRDQLDRYGELDTTARLIGKGIGATNAQLILGADDPLVASLAGYAADPKKVIFFGLDRSPQKPLASDATADSTTCPKCGRALKYSRRFYGHMGHYSCPLGHFDRPQTQVNISGLSLNDESITLNANVDGQKVSGQVGLPGVYNAYNTAATLALSHSLGVDGESALHSLHQIEAAFGRVEKLEVGDKTLYLMLVKNPTGFNQVIQTFLLDKKEQEILLIINDNFADGRDISWLWDVSFEELASRRHALQVAGIRASDMALRLKYAGIPTRHSQTKIPKALKHFIDQLPAGGTGYVIPTYTAMLESRHWLARRYKLKGIWR